jgi:hypothetical protein
MRKYRKWRREKQRLNAQAYIETLRKAALEGKTEVIYQGYRVLYRPDSPYVNKYGWVMEHRLVVMEKLQCLLDKNDQVHHKNGNKLDNRFENLSVFSRDDHGFSHKVKGAKLDSKVRLTGKNRKRLRTRNAKLERRLELKKDRLRKELQESTPKIFIVDGKPFLGKTWIKEQPESVPKKV